MWRENKGHRSDVGLLSSCTHLDSLSPLFTCLRALNSHELVRVSSRSWSSSPLAVTAAARDSPTASSLLTSPSPLPLHLCIPYLPLGRCNPSAPSALAAWDRVLARRFKKAVNRGGTTLMQKVGQVDRTDDQEFKAEEDRYRMSVLFPPPLPSPPPSSAKPSQTSATASPADGSATSGQHKSSGELIPSPPCRLEKNANALQKEAKAYLDAIRSVSASSARIANTIDLFFGSDAGEGAMAANAYKRAVEELEGSMTRGIVRCPTTFRALAWRAGS